MKRILCVNSVALFCVAALSFLIPAPARAAQFSGDYLLRLCLTDRNGKDIVPGGSTACQAYIAGILDYHNLQKSLGTAPGTVNFCVPDNADLSTLQKMVTIYLIKNRQHADFTAAPAVALALYQYYPCKEKGKKVK